MKQYISSFDGTPIFHVHHQGKNPFTLVFLHGVGSNWTVWKKEIEYFKKYGFSTLTFDLRGHGESGSPDDFDSYQLHYFSRDLHRVLRANNVQDFSLIGHSLGGAVAINYIMRYKSLFPKSLILIDTSSTFPFKHENMLNMNTYVTHFMRFLSNHKVTQKQHFFHFDDIDLSFDGVIENIQYILHILHLTPLRTMVKAIDNLEHYIFNNQKKIDNALMNLKIPTLIIAGEKDKIVPPKYSRQIKDLKKDAKFKLIKGGHHRVIIEKAKEVNHAIMKFLTTISSK
jgi:pimeloyl-ACP methyl ester carboxylesterase